MVVLKKIKSSTLMETLVATVLIVIIFTVASLLLNNMFHNQIQKNSRGLGEHLSELHYGWHNGDLPYAYAEEWGNWEIVLQKQAGQYAQVWILKATHLQTRETIIKTLEYAH